jgi:hypothetical protein
MVQFDVGSLSGCAIEAFKRAAAHPLQRRLKTEGDQHLMMPQALAAFHGPQVPYQAIAAAAHAREPAILESEHPASMHCRAIPSILDTNRFRFVHGGTNRGQVFAFRDVLTKRNFFARFASQPGADVKIPPQRGRVMRCVIWRTSEYPFRKIP